MYIFIYIYIHTLSSFKVKYEVFSYSWEKDALLLTFRTRNTINDLMMLFAFALTRKHRFFTPMKIKTDDDIRMLCHNYMTTNYEK